MSGICDGRVVVITGAGRGLGRSHALEFARQGAKVVVNDLGVAMDGEASASSPADDVVEEIRSMGGEAVANGDDASDWEGARRLIAQAVQTFGTIDTLVNNAGILRDRMLINMTESDWDAVSRVHLKGTFAPTRWAAVHWRERAKSGEQNEGRVVCTSSSTGLYGNAGQINYGAAKAGIAAFAVIAALELARYGVTANAIAPMALTRMNEDLPFGHEVTSRFAEGFNPLASENVSPLVVWLGSAASREVTGRIFNVHGGYISVAEGWRAGPSVDKKARWDPAELSDVIPDLVAKAGPTTDITGTVPEL
jgi:NAD(P)-dependent dehydrogenase (short-subunit alcohol dehydrogenase family)